MRISREHNNNDAPIVGFGPAPPVLLIGLYCKSEAQNSPGGKHFDDPKQRLFYPKVAT